MERESVRMNDEMMMLQAPGADDDGKFKTANP
jgi:hypothetical protein